MRYIIAIFLVTIGFAAGALTVKLDWQDYQIEKVGERVTFEIDGYKTFFVDLTSDDRVIDFKARNFGIFEIVGK